PGSGASAELRKPLDGCPQRLLALAVGEADEAAPALWIAVEDARRDRGDADLRCQPAAELHVAPPAADGGVVGEDEVGAGRAEDAKADPLQRAPQQVAAPGERAGEVADIRS